MTTKLTNLLRPVNFIRKSTPQLFRAPLPPAIIPSTPIIQPATVREQIVLKRGGVFTVNQGFDETDSVNFLAANAPQTQTLLTVTVPKGTDQSLLITQFGNDLSDVMAWGYYTWNMYIDDIPVLGYSSLKSQLGQTNLMRRVGIDILVNAGQTLRVDATNVAALDGVPIGGNYSVLVSLIGIWGIYDYNRDE